MLLHVHVGHAMATAVKLQNKQAFYTRYVHIHGQATNAVRVYGFGGIMQLLCVWLTWIDASSTQTSYRLLNGQTWRGLGASLKNQCQTLVFARTCTRGWHRAYTKCWPRHKRSRTGNLGCRSECNYSNNMHSTLAMNISMGKLQTWYVCRVWEGSCS